MGFSQANGYGLLVTSAEAEDGILTGTIKSSSGSGYSGTGFVTGFDADGDKVSVSVTVPVKEMYKIVIRYRCSGAKYQDFAVNAGYSSSVYFPATSSFVYAEAGNYLLDQGANTLIIKKSWGWIDIDKFEVFPAEKNVFNIVDKLVDPAANIAAVNLYDFLKMQFGERIITGQTSGYYTEIKNLTGKSPMLKAGDFGSFTEGYPYKWVNGAHGFGKVPDNTVTDLINWYNSSGKKGLVAMHWHWCSPTGGVAGTNTFYTEFTNFDITKAVTPGTQEYTYIIRDIDAIAAELKKFQNAGVPVLWRPLHEAGGGWFWWGAKGPVACKKLWNIMYDRMMNYHQLHNLIWVWSTPETDWYPGNDKVDIIGHDSYPGVYNYGNQKNAFDRLFKLTNGEKLIAMTENGPIPDVDESLNFGAPWLYIMSWVDLVLSQNSNSHIIEVYNHPKALSLESTNAFWRSSLYPVNWRPDTKDIQGRFLHDFSYAGYQQGEKQIPLETTKITDITLPPYNADNTGVNDVTSIIQLALNTVGKEGGGVVYLPAGKYKIKTQADSSYAIDMQYDSTVLRGAGPDATFLFHDESNMRNKDIIRVEGKNADWFSPIGDSTLITFDLSDPTRIIPVSSVSGFVKGDQIILTSSVTDAFIAEHKMTGLWDQESLEGVAFLRKIDSVDVSNKLIYIDSPTRYFLKTRDNSRVYHVNKHVRETGIENLSIGNIQNPNTGWAEEDYSIPGTGAYEVHSSHAIAFKNAEDCWIKNVRSYKPDVNSEDVELLSNGLILEQSRNITVDSCIFSKPQYEGGGGNGYMYTLESNDCLIKNSNANHGRHNFDFKYPYSNGNVIHKCRSENSKYASDFHMYLSMANLFDQCVLNSDYLESTFRPSGGTAIHGYTSTQSVFYNTVGEAYHPTKDYLIDSKQFGWGYVIGTSGPASAVVTEPAVGSSGGYNYDTAPADFVEGVGKGSELRPVSLYLDQFEKRMKDTIIIRKYRLEVQIKDDVSNEKITDALIKLNDLSFASDTSGSTIFTGLEASFTLGVEKELYLNSAVRQFTVSHDTSILIYMVRKTYSLSITVKDIKTSENLWGAEVSVDGEKKTTDSNGIVTFSVKWGDHKYRLDNLSYRTDSGLFSLNANASKIYYMLQTQADAKFRLKNYDTPVNDAVVKINDISLITNALGIALFENLPLETAYNFDITVDGYFGQTGEFFLSKDTVIDIALVKSTIGIDLQSNRSKVAIWPNPVSEILHLSIPREYGLCCISITDLFGKRVFENTQVSEEFEINTGSFPSGAYIVRIYSGTLNKNFLLIKE